MRATLAAIVQHPRTRGAADAQQWCLSASLSGATDTERCNLRGGMAVQHGCRVDSDLKGHLRVTGTLVHHGQAHWYADVARTGVAPRIGHSERSGVHGPSLLISTSAAGRAGGAPGRRTVLTPCLLAWYAHRRVCTLDPSLDPALPGLHRIPCSHPTGSHRTPGLHPDSAPLAPSCTPRPCFSTAASRRPGPHPAPRNTCVHPGSAQHCARCLHGEPRRCGPARHAPIHTPPSVLSL